MADLKNVRKETKKFARILSNSQKNNENIGQKFETLGEQLYRVIKDKIIYHEIKPGERIVDKHLAEELGVSRSLVRQIFTILEKEELIYSIPRSGFYVKKLSRKDVQDIYNIRKILETYATECSVPRILEEQIEEVEELLNEAEKSLGTGKQSSKVIEADARLHKMLISNCGNERLINLIDKYSSQYIFYRVIDLSREERAKDSFYEHLEIFKAVKARDVERAVELMSRHIENAQEIILANFDKYTFGEKEG